MFGGRWCGEELLYDFWTSFLLPSDWLIRPSIVPDNKATRQQGNKAQGYKAPTSMIALIKLLGKLISTQM
jgi:hypothetical protein